jgi:hypothetical protein
MANPSAPVACANCGTPVAGNFCSNCGQRVHHVAHSLWHFASEVIEDLTHADSRLWLTVWALLFKPGLLTREFLDGRRVRYLPPLRLYLVLSLLFFLVAALSPSSDVKFVTLPKGDISSISEQAVAAPRTPESRQNSDKDCDELETHGAWGRLLGKGCHQAVADDGRKLSEGLKHNLPRVIFLGLPILALAMKPLFRRQRRYYVEHVLFLLHNHSFIFLWFAIYNALCLLIPAEAVRDGLFYVFLLYVPYYYFRSMRRVYADGPWLTFGKFSVLAIAYFIVAVALLIAVSLYSLATQGA